MTEDFHLLRGKGTGGTVTHPLKPTWGYRAVGRLWTDGGAWHKRRQASPRPVLVHPGLPLEQMGVGRSSWGSEGEGSAHPWQPVSLLPKGGGGKSSE